MHGFDPNGAPGVGWHIAPAGQSELPARYCDTQARTDAPNGGGMVTDPLGVQPAGVG
jgi:hypothetical protein